MQINGKDLGTARALRFYVRVLTAIWAATLWRAALMKNSRTPGLSVT